MRGQVEEGYTSLTKLQDVLPSQILKMLATLHEMKNGVGADDTGDYWEERHQIDHQIGRLSQIKDRNEGLLIDINERRQEFVNLDNSAFYSNSDFETGTYDQD